MPTSEHSPLVGVHEIEAKHGIPRYRVMRLLRRKLWPRPVAELRAGRVWRERDVDRAVARLKRDGHL